MKLNKTLAIGAIALAVSSYASAAVNIYIVGSNGDRSATQKGIEDILSGSNWAFQGDKGAGNQSNSVVSNEAKVLASGYGAWTGTYNGTNVVIRVSYIGAAGALYALAKPNTERFVVADGSAGYTTSASIKSPYATNAVITTDYTTNYPNFGLSTIFQGTSPYNGGTYDSLVSANVGVSPIVIVASQGASNSTIFPASNITSQQAQTLFEIGYLRLSSFTGNSADSNSIVYAIGRNTDAGQRYAFQAETGIGTANSVKQWTNTLSGALTNGTTGVTYGGTATASALWPVETVSGVNSTTIGNSGYSSGSLVASLLTVTSRTAPIRKNNATAIAGATNSYYVGYITIGDYNTTVTNNPNATLLGYNGVTYSSNNLVNGQYTSWVYNRVLERSDARVAGGALSDAIIAAFKDALVSDITTSAGSANGGILINSLNVSRGADGGIVTPN